MAKSIGSTTSSSAMAPSSTRSHRFRNISMIQDFHLVWLDGGNDTFNDNHLNCFITDLTQIFDTINTFIDADECLDFITDVKEKAFVIMSGEYDQFIISIMQDIPQVNYIYIFSELKVPHEKWDKVSDIYSDTITIYAALKQAAQEYDQNSVSISFPHKTDTTANQRLNTLESSFMYTQILKEILLTINFEKVHFDEFIRDFRDRCADDESNLEKVAKIEEEYRKHQPIWWYSYEPSFYAMLNRALRQMDANLIVNMGFFVRDLHEHITKLHAEQFGVHHRSKSFIVYRGQGLSQKDFNQLQLNNGGLLAFNNFLSTTLNRQVSHIFAESTAIHPDLVGVLFVMHIDPSISSTPFANITGVGYFPEEEEILFSMHSVFRIQQVKPIEETSNRLWQVELTLTGDHDPQLEELRMSMRQEPARSTGWFRLARLMMAVAQFDKAQQLFEIILTGATDIKEIAEIYYYLGWIKCDQGNNTEAIIYYEKALEIQEETLPANHPDLAISYNNIGSVYHNMAEYSEALLYYGKALEIGQKTLPENHRDLAISYNNIGSVYNDMAEYSEALSYYDKALKIRQKTLPANHPHLATSYNNIGLVYKQMTEYSKALLYYDKAIEIGQKALPENHPDLASSYNNIGSVYSDMAEYSEALSYYEKALEIRRKTLPENHPDLAISYNNIGLVYIDMAEYSKALSYLEKAREIFEKSLPANHPNLANCYSNIGDVYDKLAEYSEALSYFEKARDIEQKTLPVDHPNLAISYGNIGSVYKRMAEYSKALSNYKKALKIQKKALPENHPDLATTYNNIGSVYSDMTKYSKALSYYEKALKIQEKTLPENHPDLAATYNSIGSVYDNTDEYSKSLSYYKKALKVQKKTLSVNHPDLATTYNNLGGVHRYMGKHLKALSYLKNALNILQCSLPPSHPDIKTVKKNIKTLRKNWK